MSASLSISLAPASTGVVSKGASRAKLAATADQMHEEEEEEEARSKQGAKLLHTNKVFECRFILSEQKPSALLRDISDADASAPATLRAAC